LAEHGGTSSRPYEKEEIEMNRTLRTREMLAAAVALIAVSVALSIVGTAHAYHTQTVMFDTDTLDWPYGVAFVTTVNGNPSGTEIRISGSTGGVAGTCTYVRITTSPGNSETERKLARNCRTSNTGSFPFRFKAELRWNWSVSFIGASFCREVAAADQCTSAQRLYMN
jgi:hypothetical protein